MQVDIEGGRFLIVGGASLVGSHCVRAFLDASDWPVTPDFPRQTLGLALYRQAIGLAQHRTMDVFEPIAARIPLNDIATLDELALALFRV